MAAVSRTYLLRKTTFFSHVFITVFSFLRISNFFVCIIHVKAYNPFVSAHDETRECIFAAFRMPIRVDARVRRDRKTWSIYYSLFQYRRCDRQSVSTSKSSALVLFFPTLFALFALFDTEKNKKCYSTPTTPLRTRTSLRSLDKKLDSLTRCVFCRRSLSSWSLFSSLVARSL